ncbi:hypothetical protein [Streptomyces sp. rh34]|uniref:hypothetical protein n=1 Tax=Streptomyces sp. rh34 TaxID=2034272 RepID=UPI00117F6B25|nr:hypothetical protein [Streptomyces sp. rh34]
MTPIPSHEAAPARRGPVRAYLAAGVLFSLVTAWLLLLTTPQARDDERAFTTATACTAPGGGDPACLRTVTAVIDRAEKETMRKTPSYWLHLTEADGTSTRTRIESDLERLPAARPGATIEVTYWQDQIRYVAFGPDRRYTNADPREAFRMPLAIGLLLGILGAMFLTAAAATAWSGRRSPRAFPWQVGLTVTGGTFLSLFGALAAWSSDNIGDALQLTALAGAVVLAACALAALFLHRRHRGDDTIALRSSVLTEETCFPGLIMGEVPYAGNAGYLVAGPGVLATTPDPTGAFHRRTAPRALAPLRVRPPYLTDPPGRPDYDGRAVVVECEDNGVPVLVVTRKRDAPAVLGALGPRTTPE